MASIRPTRSPNRRARAFRPCPPQDLERRVVASAGVAIHPAEIRSLASVRVERDVAYRDVPGDHQTLDLLIPSGPAPAGGWPVVVAIHGGGWRKYFKEQYEPTVAPLVDRGFLVVAPNYRLSKPGAPTWPVNFEEVRDAVRWVRDHASEIGADPDRIAAMGASAGGHLAALLGTDAEGPPDESASATSARVQAVVDFYGPTDLAALDATSPDARLPIRQYLGVKPSLDPARAAAASPLAHVTPGDPPFLIVQGTADGLVRPSQSRALASRLSAAGVANRLVLVPGAEHGFGLRVGGRDLLAPIVTFLRGAMPARSLATGAGSPR